MFGVFEFVCDFECGGVAFVVVSGVVGVLLLILVVLFAWFV